MSEAKLSAATAARPTPARSGAAVPGKNRGGRPAQRQAPVSRDAQRFAAAILEVLAGVRTPADAADALDLSLPRYYLWEQRALEGLVRACEPRPKGQAAHERHQVAVLEKELGRLRLDCARQQALVRASQRTMSLIASAPPARKPPVKAGPKPVSKTADGGKGKRKRRPVARALKAVVALQAPLGEEIPADSPTAASVPGAEVVQRSVPSSSLATADIAPAQTAPSDVAVPQT